MALTRQQKQEVLKELKDRVESQKIMVFVDFQGLKTKDLTDLRSKLKNQDSVFSVVKKTLLKLALKEKGIKSDIKKMEGELGIVFGFKDIVAPSKTVYDFAQNHNKLPKILGGFFEGDWQGEETIAVLAKIPSREVLLGKLVGSVYSPVFGFVSVLQGNIRSLVYALSAIKPH